MTTPTNSATAGANLSAEQTATIKQLNLPKSLGTPKFSGDGKWLSFSGVENLILYCGTGVYFARAKVGSNTIRKTLDTDVYSTAVQRLPDTLKEIRKPKAKLGTFKEARLAYESALEADHDLQPASKLYRKNRIAALLKSWPGLDELSIKRFMLKSPSPTAYKKDPAYDMCNEWAGKYQAKFDGTNFNNTLGSLRKILEFGDVPHDLNAACRVKRVGVQKQLRIQLPTNEQFGKMLEVIQSSGAGQAQHCADLVAFLSYSGCRISEARKVTWADVDFDKGHITVQNAKRSKWSNHSLTRNVSFTEPMRPLLERMKREQNPQPTDRVCILSECEKSLVRACEKVGIPKLTHHDLRHYYASVCIESSVDIPTLSRWLGHVDGGKLAMETYGHLREEHSSAMAAKVSFGKPALPPNAVRLSQPEPGKEEDTESDLYAPGH